MLLTLDVLSDTHNRSKTSTHFSTYKDIFRDSALTHCLLWLDQLFFFQLFNIPTAQPKGVKIE